MQAHVPGRMQSTPAGRVQRSTCLRRPHAIYTGHMHAWLQRARPQSSNEIGKVGKACMGMLEDIDESDYTYFLNLS